MQGNFTTAEDFHAFSIIYASIETFNFFGLVDEMDDV